MSIAQGVFFEMLLKAELVFTVLLLAAEKSKRRAKTHSYMRATTESDMVPISEQQIAFIGIGLALLIAKIAGALVPHSILPNPSVLAWPCRTSKVTIGYTGWVQHWED